MAEEKKGGGWIKAIFGLASGVAATAVVSYLTPIFDRAVKPSRPLANFEKQLAGYVLTLENRTVSAVSGWWDFGDGTALEPFDPHQEAVSHKYDAPGDYTVKLSVQNVIGEENERTVQVHIDKPQAVTPKISDFTITPLNPYAPATFRVTAKVQNAQLLVWDMDDGRSPQIVNDANEVQDRVFTYPKAGTFELKLTAHNGDHTTQSSDIVTVMQPPRDALVATLEVTDQGTEVKTLPKDWSPVVSFADGSKDSTLKFDRSFAALPDYQIADVIPILPPTKDTPAKETAGLQGKSELALDAKQFGLTGAKDLSVKVDADRKAIHFTGSLDRGPKSSVAPLINLHFKIVLQKKASATQPPVAVTGHLNARGGPIVVTLPPAPPGWLDVHRQVHFKLSDGSSVLLDQPQLAAQSEFTYRNRHFQLLCTQQGDGIKLDMIPTH